jgi:integrase
MLARMASPTEAPERTARTPKLTREAKLSPDGKWRSFPKVPNLVQYVSTGTYYGRVKIDGKVFRESLGTDVFTTAKLLLGDFIKKKRKRASHPVPGTFAVAREAYEAELAADHTLKESSKLYRRNCILSLTRSWPELDALPPTKVTVPNCREWAARLAAKYSPTVFNNTLGTLRMILERAGLGHDDNPARKVKRLGVKPKELKLPEPSQFEALLETVENGRGRFSRDCADFMRFLAFSGCRLNEAALVRWQDVSFERNEIRVHNSKSAKTTNKPEFRFVPIIPPMRELLLRLKPATPLPEDPVCSVRECEKSLTKACELRGIARITHHDLRHLFATRCIESGVDIPTVSRWLGHSDGGALAMKTYGHLRREHSAAMAQRVTFGSQASAANPASQTANV